MKKIMIAILGIFLLTGCTDMMNTPTKRVEEFLGKYQTMDKDVLKQLDSVIDDDKTLSDEQKKEYRELMKKQYQNLAYKVKDETIDGDTATVDIEIEVFDFHGAMKKAESDLETNKKDFYDDDNKLDEKKFMDHKIKTMKETKEKVKYTLNFTLNKKDKKWVMDDITETERQKLHGLYSY